MKANSYSTMDLISLMITLEVLWEPYHPKEGEVLDFALVLGGESARILDRTYAVEAELFKRATGCINYVDTDSVAIAWCLQEGAFALEDMALAVRNRFLPTTR